MVDFRFTIDGVKIEPFFMAPTVFFKMRVAKKSSAVKVQNMQLRCQVRIEATRRHHAPEDHERLLELFGESHECGEILPSMGWTDTTVQVPTFENECVVDLPVACSFDFNVAATKYFHSLGGGEVPLAFLFSGAAFYRGPDGLLQIDQLSVDQNRATYSFPVHIWREMMDLYYPDTTWLRINREVFDDFCRYKRQNGFKNWEQTLRALLEHTAA